MCGCELFTTVVDILKASEKAVPEVFIQVTRSITYLICRKLYTVQNSYWSLMARDYSIYHANIQFTIDVLVSSYHAHAVCAHQPFNLHVLCMHSMRRVTRWFAYNVHSVCYRVRTVHITCAQIETESCVQTVRAHRAEVLGCQL